MFRRSPSHLQSQCRTINNTFIWRFIAFTISWVTQNTTHRWNVFIFNHFFISFSLWGKILQKSLEHIDHQKIWKMDMRYDHLIKELIMRDLHGISYCSVSSISKYRTELIKPYPLCFLFNRLAATFNACTIVSDVKWSPTLWRSYFSHAFLALSVSCQSHLSCNWKLKLFETKYK